MSIDYAARFEGLDSDRLFEIEYGGLAVDLENSDPDDVDDYMRELLAVLADWRGRLLDGSRSDAGDYQRSLDRVREAWLQYSFRWVGGPDLPCPFDLPARTVERR